ncbi:hypothetical protein GCM10010344_25450 [Streptomyces bluensis]|nr:hypothetical protein GCM10010344_25450 [Streptomyces bluensis]
MTDSVMFSKILDPVTPDRFFSWPKRQQGKGPAVPWAATTQARLRAPPRTQGARATQSPPGADSVPSAYWAVTQ